MFEYNQNDLYKVLHPETEEIFRAVTQDERNRELLELMNRHDKGTYYHMLRVGMLCIDMGFDTGFREEDVYTLGEAGLLHDTGKLEIDENILSKDGLLDDKEWGLVKKHPRCGVQILKEYGYPNRIIEMVGSHHEHKRNGAYLRSSRDRRKHPRFIQGGICVDRRFVVQSQFNDPKPEVYNEGEKATIFSKFIATADVLDALNDSSRHYRNKTPLSLYDMRGIMRNELKVEDRIIQQALRRYNEPVEQREICYSR